MNYYESPPGITPAAAAQLLGVGIATVREMVKKGKLDRIFTGVAAGRHQQYLITEESVKRCRVGRKSK